MDKKAPSKFYLNKNFILNNDKMIDCHSIYTERQSEDDIEYIINK